MHKLVEHRPLAELFGQVLDLLFEAVPAERAAILLLEGEPPEPVIKASRARQGQTPPTRVSRSIARKVVDDQKSLLMPNLMEDAAFSTQDSILSTGIRSAVCAPLLFTSTTGGEDSVIGLVYLDSLMRSRPFTEDDLRVVTALANLAAAKIENVRLLEESLEKRRMEDDMRVAAEIQRGLLPSKAPGGRRLRRGGLEHAVTHRWAATTTTSRSTTAGCSSRWATSPARGRGPRCS